MRSLVAALFISITLLAGARVLSPLPLPSLTIINLDTYQCDNYCLEEFLQNEQYFSFLAHLDKDNIEDFKPQYQNFLSLFHLKPILPIQHMAIDLYCHKRTRSICNHLAKAATSYYLHRKVPFAINTHIIENNITFDSISYETDALNILIATYSESNSLSNLPQDARFFIPTLHASSISQSSDNLYFGGIDYKAQIDELLQLSQYNLAIFYLKNSMLSSYLTKIAQENYDKAIKLYPVDKAYSNLKQYLQNNEDLNASALLLNTPPIKTSLILSQLPLYAIEPPMKLSTQINFTPKLFSLIQSENRKELYIAHIAPSYPKAIDAYAAMLHEDLFYSWLDYTTIVGIDNFFAITQNAPKKLREDFTGNQLRFDTQISKTTAFGFETVQKALENREGF